MQIRSSFWKSIEYLFTRIQKISGEWKFRKNLYSGNFRNTQTSKYFLECWKIQKIISMKGQKITDNKYWEKISSLGKFRKTWYENLEIRLATKIQKNSSKIQKNSCVWKFRKSSSWGTYRKPDVDENSNNLKINKFWEKFIFLENSNLFAWKFRCMIMQKLLYSWKFRIS